MHEARARNKQSQTFKHLPAICQISTAGTLPTLNKLLSCIDFVASREPKKKTL